MGCASSSSATAPSRKPLHSAKYIFEAAPPGLAASLAALSTLGPGGRPGRPPPGKSFTSADFILRDIVGKGGKSVGVRVAFHPESGSYCAIKIIDVARAAHEAWEVQPADELAVLQDVTAAGLPFITPLLGSYSENGVLALVLAYMPGGELFSRMGGRLFTSEEALFYAAEIVAGLAGLHGRGYLYRDLKPENVLLDANGHAHLCDLGFTVKGPVGHRRLGTPQYQAPEICAPDVATVGYTAAVDWWALGCLLHEMMTGYVPFGRNPAATPDEVAAETRAGLVGDDLLKHVGEDARSLISALLVVDPAARLADAASVKAHPFFKRVDWDALTTQRYFAPWVPPPLRFPGDVANFDLYLRMEGQTIVARGAAARVLHELPPSPMPKEGYWSPAERSAAAAPAPAPAPPVVTPPPVMGPLTLAPLLEEEEDEDDDA